MFEQITRHSSQDKKAKPTKSSGGSNIRKLSTEQSAVVGAIALKWLAVSPTGFDFCVATSQGNGNNLSIND